MKNVLGMLKTGSKRERLENILISVIFLGVAILTIGIALTILSPKGFSVVVTLAGSFLTFIFTIALVIFWFIKGD